MNVRLIPLVATMACVAALAGAYLVAARATWVQDRRAALPVAVALGLQVLLHLLAQRIRVEVK